jgi:hypothetical protein
MQKPCIDRLLSIVAYSACRVFLLLVIAASLIPRDVLAYDATHSAGHGRSHNPGPQSTLLKPDDGLAIIAAALKLRSRLDSGYDCSHLVNVVYRNAGFPYKYATLVQLYEGNSRFRRVLHPQPGDLVVFLERLRQGHVGIVVTPSKHLFFSGLNHGPGVSSFTSRYWRERGVPHFFRYVRKPPPKTHTALRRRVVGRP